MNSIRIISVMVFLCMSFIQTTAQPFLPASDPGKILAQLKKQNSGTSTLQADFREEKHLTILKEPQISSGKFYYQKNDKMRWEQQLPYPYIMLITGDKLLIRENGVTKDVSATSRMAGKMKNMLLELIRGDFQSSNAFEVKVFESTESFMINLTPIEKRLKNYYQEIHMVFSRKSLHLQELKFLEKKGNYTVTRFQNEKVNQRINSEIFSTL